MWRRWLEDLEVMVQEWLKRFVVVRIFNESGLTWQVTRDMCSTR